MSPNLEKRARIFATEAHERIDQRRKFTGEPYIVHPAAVAEIVRSVAHDDAMIAAAYLHDVVEDTPVTIGEIQQEFGADVAELVGWLTKPPNLDFDRATRRARERAHSAAAPARAQTIKVADIINNCATVRALAPEYAATYIPERLLMLEGLTKADPTLVAEAREVLAPA